MFDSTTTVVSLVAESGVRVDRLSPRRRLGSARVWLLFGMTIVLTATGAATVYFFNRKSELAASNHQTIATAPVIPASSQVNQPLVLTVTVTTIEAQPLIRTLIGDGSVVAWQELVIGAEIGGMRVIEVAVDEGDTVFPGQLLVRFDGTVLAAQAAQAEAAIVDAEAAAQIAHLDLGRATELSREAIASRQAVEQRQTAWRQAQARLVSARAKRDEAVARLAQAQIVAPTGGVIARRSVLLGSVVAAGHELFRLIRDGRLELDAKVPELDIAAVQAGQRARVTHGDRTIEAEVRSVAPIVATDTRLGLVHIILPSNSGLRPGMFARAEIRVAETQAFLVPQAAVVFRAGLPMVFVLGKDEHASLRPVTTGVSLDNVVQITSGLRAGEQIIVSGAGFLSDGDRVQTARQLAAVAY